MTNIQNDSCDLEEKVLKSKNVCKDMLQTDFKMTKHFEDQCINRISFSELKDHVECSYRHKLKYVDKINMFEENVNTNFGTALHEACEHYLKTREMKYEIALDYIIEAWEKYGLPDLGQWLKEANALLEAVPGFLDDRFPGWECFSAEEFLNNEPIPGDHILDVAFKGYIDAVIKQNDKFYLCEWKSSGKGWSSYKKKDDNLKMQLILYAKFWGAKHKIPLSKIRVGFIILNRDLENPERIEFFSFSVEEKDTKKTLVILNNSIGQIRKGQYFKCWKYSIPYQQGSCRFCDYNETKYCP